MKRKTFPLLEKVEIIDTSAEGNALGRHENMVVFVDHAVPGDVVDVQLYAKKKNFGQGRITHFHKKSDLRVEPFCEHFGLCGGCKWQHMGYDNQLKYKEKHVYDALERIGKISIEEKLPILGSVKITEYRNRLDFAFTNKRWLYDHERNTEEGGFEGETRAVGFHIPGKFDKVFDVHKCYLQNDFQNRVRNEVKDFCLKNNYSFFDLRSQEGFMRGLILRNTIAGEWMVIVMFKGEDTEKREALLHHIKTTFPEVKSLMYVINNKRNDSLGDLEIQHFYGEPFLTEVLEGLKFKIHPKAFFQTNSLQTKVLYDVTRNFANLSGKELVYDLYTGSGTIASYVSSKAARVIGVEYVEEAIAEARNNAQLNGIGNMKFFAGDMKDVFNDAFIAEHGKPDVIITDPPRAGMHESVTLKIKELAPQRIVYVSCNPSTQARDIALLSDLYRVVKVQPVDMFPHTHHVESVALLQLRS